MVQKRTSQLSLLIEPDEREILDRYCEQVRLPIARVISQLIREHLKSAIKQQTSQGKNDDSLSMR